MRIVTDVALLCVIWIVAVFLLILFVISLRRVCELRRRDKEATRNSVNHELNATMTSSNNAASKTEPTITPMTTTDTMTDKNENENHQIEHEPNTQISNSSSRSIENGQNGGITQTEEDDDHILQFPKAGVLPSTPNEDRNDHQLELSSPSNIQSDISIPIENINNNEVNDRDKANLMSEVLPFFRRSITTSILCFAISSLFAAIGIQLEIVHETTPWHKMHQTSMVFMNVGRRLMFMMFIGRLYYTFKNTDYFLSTSVFKCLAWSFILEWGYFFGVCGTLFAIFHSLPSADPQFALPVSGIAMVWDLINFLIVARLFARNLWTLFYHTLQDCVDGNKVDSTEKDLVYLVMKYRILVFWAVATSIIVMIMLLIQISTKDYIVSLFIVVVFHNLINAICLYANFEFSHDVYDKFFHCCHNSCAHFGLWKAVHSKKNKLDPGKVTLSHIDSIVLRTDTANVDIMQNDNNDDDEDEEHTPVALEPSDVLR